MFSYLDQVIRVRRPLDIPFGDYFQEMGSDIGEQLVFFHDDVMFIITFIIILVFWVMKTTFFNKKFDLNLIHGTKIEIIWTLIPMFILLYIAFPSLKILYKMDDISNPQITLKAIGHQWYWKYEINNKTFDSYMVPTNELKDGSFRLLLVDNQAVLPINSEIRVMSIGGDVIHSFAVPSLAVKSDAIPGRLNQSGFVANRAGTFFGQCSEICGSDHSFMPINIKVETMSNYLNWYNSLD